MDLLRSTIEAFFYRFPLDMYAEALLDPMKEKSMIDILVEIVTHHNSDFTFSEVSLLGDMLRTVWLTDNEYGFDKDKVSLINRLPLLINNFSKETILATNHKAPQVRFEHLLRWRYLTLLLGEDLFTLPYLARLDLTYNQERTDFCWPNILPHDNFRLNVVLKEMLSDTHSHINAAIDVFEFNWICMMNAPELIRSDFGKTDFLASGQRLEYDLVSHHSSINLNLHQWVFLAAGIRLMLYSTLNGDNSRITSEGIRDMIAMPGLLETNFSDICNGIQRYLAASVKLNVSTQSDAQWAFDYAINYEDVRAILESQDPTTPYLIHFGERYLLYRWFRGYYGNTSGYRDLTPYVTLYMFIKAKIRRELIQSNDLVGFRNFQIYQGRKDSFLEFFPDERKRIFGEVAYRYAVQTSLGLDCKNHIEARITPSSIGLFRKMSPHKSIFQGGRDFSGTIPKNITFVIHLIKSRDDLSPAVSVYRHYDARARYWQEIISVVSEFCNNQSEHYPDITGVDAASNELLCRPEVFAPMFRYARHCGISRITYHAGEDFYDIIDGLRTIDEAVEFMGYSIGDRIGHGLALGTDAETYYRTRHHILIIPCQLLLDNVVWLRFKAREFKISLSSDTELFIERYFNELARQLGYFSISNSMYEYYCGMKMRGDIIDEASLEISTYLSPDIRFSPCSRGTDENPVISRLRDHYERDTQCREKGAWPITVTLNDSYHRDVAMVQEAMLSRLESKGVVIETNPSSNFKIGRFNRYDQHPITIFNSVTPSSDSHSIVVSLNTDDKGVFSTSLENEYSLIAISLMKKKDALGNRMYSGGQIEEYLRRIARYGNISRFES